MTVDGVLARAFSEVGGCLVVSSPGEGGQVGGVLAVTASGCESIDPVRTTGMALSPDASLLARVSLIPNEGELGELLISDGRGLFRYVRLDWIGEPHSIVWLHDGIRVVSTATNRVVHLGHHGEFISESAPGDVPSNGDRWHLNSLGIREGRLFVSAFGRFDSVRGWAVDGARSGAGVVIDVDDHTTVLSGLSAPHDPVWEGDTWLVCNSQTRSVTRYSTAGDVLQNVELGGWTRGMHVTDDFIFVGVTALRQMSSDATASVAVLDRASLAELGRVPLPVRDVFAIIPCPEDLIAGLLVGAQRGALRDTGSTLVLSNEPLLDNECACRLTLEACVASGDDGLEVHVMIHNISPTVYSSIGVYPVRVGVRGMTDGDDSVVDLCRLDLPLPLMPDGSTRVALKFPQPPTNVRVLEVSLVQESVKWFSDVDPGNGIQITIRAGN